MNDSYLCPFCGASVPLISATHKKIHVGYHQPAHSVVWGINGPTENDLRQQEELEAENMMTAYAVICPTCKKASIFGIGCSGDIVGVKYLIHPRSNAKQYPEYVPAPIRQDYQEAYEILHISPKASATLSRRCIQGMIRDTQDVKAGNLAKEIDQLKDKIPTDQWSAIDSARQIGNIGAHMEKDASIIIDIEPQEAELLLSLVEYLIQQWYISKHESTLMLEAVQRIAGEKQAQRHSN